MRSKVWDYIESCDTGRFKLSKELPWTSSGIPLYSKNLKTIYVDNAQTETDTIIAALNGLNIQNQTITVTATFACDAKNLPSDYETLMDQLIKINEIDDVSNSWKRKIVSASETISDELVTTVDYVFTKLLKG